MGGIPAPTFPLTLPSWDIGVPLSLHFLCLTNMNLQVSLSQFNSPLSLIHPDLSIAQREVAGNKGLENVTEIDSWSGRAAVKQALPWAFPREPGKGFSSLPKLTCIDCTLNLLSLEGINAWARNYKDSCCNWPRKATCVTTLPCHFPFPQPPFPLAWSPQNCWLRFPWLPMLHPLVTLRILCHCPNLFPALQQWTVCSWCWKIPTKSLSND